MKVGPMDGPRVLCAHPELRSLPLLRHSTLLIQRQSFQGRGSTDCRYRLFPDRLNPRARLECRGLYQYLMGIELFRRHQRYACSIQLSHLLPQDLPCRYPSQLQRLQRLAARRIVRWAKSQSSPQTQHRKTTGACFCCQSEHHMANASIPHAEEVE